MKMPFTLPAGMYHTSVLVEELIFYLAPQKGGLYVDATFGGGGHTRALLEAEPSCRVIAFDWDTHALDHGALLKEQYADRLELVWGNFAHIRALLKKRKIERVDGIFADFGTSQYQIATAPGFSFSVDAPLDMRMSPAHSMMTARTLVNEASEQELSDIFYLYGEERHARRIARAICSARKIRPLETTHDLVAVITSVVHFRHHGIHPATRVFQALRIAVNHELDNIEGLLKTLPFLLRSGGRAVCISFHSLEDRLVKHFIRSRADEFVNLTPKVVVAGARELEVNRSARSAKLRACERI